MTAPASKPRCPSCGDDVAFDADGSISINPLAGRAYCVNGICGCSGPRADNESDAIAAFTRPAHAVAEVERLRKAAANVVAMYQMDPLSTVDGLTDTDFIMRISALRAALAAQGGGT